MKSFHQGGTKRLPYVYRYVITRPFKPQLYKEVTLLALKKFLEDETSTNTHAYTHIENYVQVFITHNMQNVSQYFEGGNKNNPFVQVKSHH